MESEIQPGFPARWLEIQELEIGNLPLAIGGAGVPRCD